MNLEIKTLRFAFGSSLGLKNPKPLKKFIEKFFIVTPTPRFNFGFALYSRGLARFRQMENSDAHIFQIENKRTVNLSGKVS